MTHSLPVEASGRQEILHLNKNYGWMSFVQQVRKIAVANSASGTMSLYIFL